MISVEQLVYALIYLIVAGLIVSVLWWVLKQVSLPAPFDKVARIALVLISALIVIAILLSIVGHPIIRR